MPNGSAAEESAQILQSRVGSAESLGGARRRRGGMGNRAGESLFHYQDSAAPLGGDPRGYRFPRACRG